MGVLTEEGSEQKGQGGKAGLHVGGCGPGTGNRKGGGRGTKRCEVGAGTDPGRLWTAVARSLDSM